MPEVKARFVKLSYSPANYTPVAVTGVYSADSLEAHTAAIDNKLAALSAPFSQETLFENFASSDVDVPVPTHETWDNSSQVDVIINGRIGLLGTDYTLSLTNQTIIPLVNIPEKSRVDVRIWKTEPFTQKTYRSGAGVPDEIPFLITDRTFQATSRIDIIRNGLYLYEGIGFTRDVLAQEITVTEGLTPADVILIRIFN